MMIDLSKIEFLTGCAHDKIDTAPEGDTDVDTDMDTDTDVDTDVDTAETGETGEAGETGDSQGETGDTELIPPEELTVLSTESTDVVFYSDTAGSQAGAAIQFVGDADGDGFSDLLVGAPNAASEAGNPGAAYLVSGPLSSYEAFGLSGSTAQIWGDTEGQRIGAAIAGPGDLNRDGLADLVVGDYTFNYYSGAAHVIFGPVTGTFSVADASVSLVGSEGNAYGFAVQGVGDLNASGYPSVAVSELGAARVYVYPDIAVATSTDEAFILEGYTDSYAGVSLAGIGDADGDGFNDLLLGAYQDDVGASDAGAAYFIPSEGSVTVGTTVALSDAGEPFTGEVANDYAGYSVAAAGDTDYDGYADFLVGAPNNGLENGAVYLILGGVDLAPGSLSSADARFYGIRPYDYAGWAVSGGGSVNGDEFDDVVISVPRSDATVADGGEAFVFLGPVSGYHQLGSSTLDLTTATYVYGIEAGGMFGSALGVLSDVDGDGTADLIFGEPGNQDGAAHLVFGSSF